MSKTFTPRVFKKYLLASSIFTILLDIGCQSLQQQKSAVKVDLEIETSSHSFSKDILGVNSLLTQDLLTYRHPDLARKYQESGSQVVRFPGGTPANFYNFETGFLDEDPRSPKHMSMMKWMNDIMRNRQSDGYRTEDFVQFLKKTGSETNLVLNILTQDAEYTRRWLQLFKTQEQSVKYVEMGNEVYFGMYKNQLSDVDEYIHRAKEHAAAVRAVSPETKIGVVIPSQCFFLPNYLDNFQSGNRYIPRIDQWYDRMAEEDFYDAIIIHFYPKMGVARDLPLEEFPAYPTLYRNCITHVNNKMPQSMEFFRKQFGDKEFWVTEWHVGGFSKKMRKVRLRHSYLGALYSTSFFLELFQYPEIKLSGHHSLPKLVTLPPNEDFIKSEQTHTQELRKTANFSSLTYYKPAVEECHTYANVTVKGTLSYPGIDKLPGEVADLRAGYFSHEKGGYLYLINRFDRPYEIESIQWPGSQSMKVLELTQMLAPEEGLDEESIQVKEIAFDANKTMLIPPYSALRIKVVNDK